MKFKVLIQRVVIERCEVEVNAETRKAAKELAEMITAGCDSLFWQLLEENRYVLNIEESEASK